MHVQQPDFLQDQRHFQHVRHAVRLGNDVVGQCFGAVQRVHLRRRAGDRQLTLGFFRKLHEARGQRSWRAQLVDQYLDALLLAQLEVVVAHVRPRQEFGDHPLVHIRVLPQVERGQMKAEHACRVAQAAQPAARDQARLVADQRIVDHVEVAHEFGGVAIGVGVADRLPQRLMLVERARGGGQPGVDAGERAPVQLVLAVRRLVRCGGGQHAQFVAHIVQHHRRTQVGIEDVHLRQVIVERAGRLHAQRRAQHVGGDERIAVAVAADPRAHAQKAADDALVFRKGRFELVLDRVVDARQFAQEGVVVEGQPVDHLVGDRQARAPQHAGLPQRSDRAAHRFVVVGQFFRGQAGAVALVDQPGDLHFLAEDALALHLGRMRGQHRHHQRIAEESENFLRRHLGVERLAQCIGQRAGPRRVAGDGVRPGAPDVVLVLGDIGQMQEVAEGAHHDDGVVVAQSVQQLGQFRARLEVVIPAEAHAQLAHVLDDFEHAAAFLFAHHVAQHAAEQADVVEQRLVLVVCGAFVRRNGRLGLLIHVQSFQKIGQVGNAAAGLHWQGSAFHSGLLESEAVSRAVCRSRWGS